jgi:hypothetical protein
MAKLTADKPVKEIKKGYTAAGYTVPEGENETVAVIIEQVNFDGETGERLSQPNTYKTNPTQWLQFIKLHKTQGFTITKLLHIPESAKMIDLDTFYPKKKA